MNQRTLTVPERLSCTQLAVTLSRHYDVNPNYVVAGCVLHDL